MNLGALRSGLQARGLIEGRDGPDQDWGYVKRKILLRSYEPRQDGIKRENCLRSEIRREYLGLLARSAHAGALRGIVSRGHLAAMHRAHGAAAAIGEGSSAQ